MPSGQNNQMISRIKAMEQSLDEVQSVRQLTEYYHGPEWREDMEADEAGLLPYNLKRGVLSEDGIWNTLAHYREILERMAELSKE